MSPHEYIDLFADEVGHERGIAEGEVRWSPKPPYPARYRFGALYIYAIWKDIFETGQIAEKDFYDRFGRWIVCRSSWYEPR
jgi:hypothetical protein